MLLINVLWLNFVDDNVEGCTYDDSMTGKALLLWIKYSDEEKNTAEDMSTIVEDGGGNVE